MPLLYDFFAKFDYLYVLNQANTSLETEKQEVPLSVGDLIYEVEPIIM